MLNMRVVVDEDSTTRAVDSPAKHKAGHRLQAAILRNIHHERKLRLECEALQKAKKTVANDLRQIEQKLHKVQRHPTCHDIHGNNHVSCQLNGKKPMVERSHSTSKADQPLHKIKTFPGSNSACRNSEGDSRLSVRFKEDVEAIPSYGQRFLNMLEGLYDEKNSVNLFADSPKMESRGRGMLRRSFSMEQTDDWNAKERGVKGTTGEIAFSNRNERVVGNTNAAAERQILHDDKLKQEVSGFSRHLVKMDHLTKRRSSGTDDMEKAITDSIVHLGASGFSGSEMRYARSQATKYQEHYGWTGSMKQKWRGCERRRGSQPICAAEALAMEFGMDHIHPGEDRSFGSFEVLRKQSSEGDLKSLIADGVSADSVEEFLKKIRKPTITKDGEMYDQAGCFITTVKKTEN